MTGITGNQVLGDFYTVTHFIDGRRTPAIGGDVQDIFNPATGRVVGEVQLATQGDVDKVVASSKNAAHEWAQASQVKRSKILFNMREKFSARIDDIAALITREHGKTLDDAKGEIGRALEAVEHACGVIDHLKGDYSSQVATNIDVYSIRQPLGVVAGITPFNFPIMVPMWMAPLAIATGNAFILKPSERDPSPSLMLAELWREAGLPEGVFNVLQGGKEAVDGLLTHPDVDGVSFVGSTPIAKYVYEAATLHRKRVQALGGAKNHVVVMPDADMDIAAEHISNAAFGSAGERCMAISVAIAVGSAADVLAEKLRAEAKKVVVREGTHADANMGPLVTAQSKTRVERIIGEAESAGARLIVDGRDIKVSGYEGGFFVGPTVVDCVTTDMSVYKEEIFGPVIVLLHVPTLNDAIRIINSNPYGNGTGIFTASGAAAREFQLQVKVGMVGVNVPVPVPVSWYSFGGWGDSMFGDLHVYGPDGVRFYTRNKVITQRWPEPSGDLGATSFSFPNRH